MATGSASWKREGRHFSVLCSFYALLGKKKKKVARTHKIFRFLSLELCEFEYFCPLYIKPDPTWNSSYLNSGPIDATERKDAIVRERGDPDGESERNSQTEKEIGVSRDGRRAEKDDQKTNREEIQFQTSQFNQAYSSPGSNNGRNALKTHKKHHKDYITHSKGQDWFKIARYTCTISCLQCKVCKYIKCREGGWTDARRDERVWWLRMRAGRLGRLTKKGGEAVKKRPYLAKGDRKMLVKRMER